ncbi:hypothetical protein [Thermococcus sp.]
MRQKVVWFVLGVLVGSLFVVSAYPTGGNVQYVTPAVQRIPGSNYTTLLLYTPNGLPLNVKEVQKAVQEFVLKSAPNAKWHVYAVPELPKGTVITGYGIKVTKDGRAEMLIIATREGVPILTDKIQDELLGWSKKAPKFPPAVIPKEKIGVPRGWEVKTVDSSGNVRVYTGESEPYWKPLGEITIRVNDPPYGNIYALASVYGLEDDNDPNLEYFLVAPPKNAPEEGRYEIDPGYGLREVEGNTNYKDYVTESAKIIHDWNMDSSLNPKLKIADPILHKNGHTTVQVTFGYPVPAVTFTSTIPNYEMLPAVDRSTQIATWLLKFDTDSSDAKYSFGTNVASEGYVSQSVLHNGQWHAIVNVKFQATFIQAGDILGWWGDHTTWEGVTFYVKVS